MELSLHKNAVLAHYTLNFLNCSRWVILWLSSSFKRLSSPCFSGMFLGDNIIYVDLESLPHSPILSPARCPSLHPSFSAPLSALFFHRYVSADLSHFLRPLSFVSDRIFYLSTARLSAKSASTTLYFGRSS